jgi:hypothetical protein
LDDMRQHSSFDVRPSSLLVCPAFGTGHLPEDRLQLGAIRERGCCRITSKPEDDVNRALQAKLVSRVSRWKRDLAIYALLAAPG